MALPVCECVYRVLKGDMLWNMTSFSTKVLFKKKGEGEQGVNFPKVIMQDVSPRPPRPQGQTISLGFKFPAHNTKIGETQ